METSISKTFVLLNGKDIGAIELIFNPFLYEVVATIYIEDKQYVIVKLAQ